MALILSWNWEPSAVNYAINVIILRLLNLDEQWLLEYSPSFFYFAGEYSPTVHVGGV